MDKQAEARRLRDEGYLFYQIASKLNISKTSARNYVLGLTSANRRQQQRERRCNRRRPDTEDVCERGIGHLGVHLANDKNGNLVFWE